MKKEKVFVAVLCLISVGVIFMPSVQIRHTVATYGESSQNIGDKFYGLYAIKIEKSHSAFVETDHSLKDDDAIMVRNAPLKNSEFIQTDHRELAADEVKDGSTSIQSSHQQIGKEESAINGTDEGQVETIKTGLVRWSLYGKKKWNLTSSPFSQHQKFSVDNITLLDTVPKDFQESLLSAVPLDCHPGPEGVFKKKHSKFLNALAEYASEHSKMKSQPSSRTLIWQCGFECGGLSDRIRGITFSLLLAIFTRRRLIVFMRSEEAKYLHPNMIDWKDEAAYQYLRRKETREPFKSPASFTVTKVPSQAMSKCFQAVRSSRTNVLIMIRIPPNAFLTFSQEWIKSALKQYGLVDLSINDFNSLIGPAFRYMFKLDDVIINEMHLARNVLGLTHPYVALHVRSGFIGMSGQEIPSYKHMRTPSEWKASYQKAVSISDTTLGKDSLLFLSTDSGKVKELAMKKYPHRFRTLHNKILHYSKVAASHVKREEGNLLIWVELLLLAQANTLVKGNSGYSTLSGFLCGLDLDNAIITV